MTIAVVWVQVPLRVHSVAEVAQLVEHNLPKVGVAGSSPVFRSFSLCGGTFYSKSAPVLRFVPNKSLPLRPLIMTKDEKYMRRCLSLALRAEGCTSPNPMVGALLVVDDRVVGEGYHHRAGCPHAEPNAINSVEDKALLTRATLYVSLESCSHWGRTPPCADLIVRSGIPRVVVATLDPNPRVAGRGVQILRQAGVQVTVGVLEQEARWLNRRFFTTQIHHRPYVTLKWAETEDGFIDLCRDTRGDGPVRISNAVTKTLNHRMRTTEDAIMVATRTALLDDPHLTVTKWTGHNPLRVLLDRTLRVPPSARIFDNTAPTLLLTASHEHDEHTYGPSVEVATLDFSRDLPAQVLDALYRRGVQSVIIEGGARWLSSVIESGLWDEAHVERSPMRLGSGVAAPHLGRCSNRPDLRRLMFGADGKTANDAEINPAAAVPTGHCIGADSEQYPTVDAPEFGVHIYYNV